MSIEDYQEYWQRSDEAISSLYSRGYRGHYKAANYSRDLSALQAAKLSACTKKGIPLARWGVGLTVLLEKTCGNNLINKMRTICLLKADFNWLNKLIYARRMMNSTLDENLIPLECFAKKGSNCVNVVMTKTIYCDKSRTHHHPMIVLCNDFADCYDRVAFPVAEVALQSFGIPIEAVRVLLLAMQTMKYFLQTGFGESSQSYGGSMEDRMQGFGKGNAAAGPGFLAISVQIVNAYLRDGHGSQTLTSYSHCLLTLAAILYVDNTDMIHATPSVSATAQELISHTQDATNTWGGLAITTGAALKPEKCFRYILNYKFINGRAVMGGMRSPPHPICNNTTE